MNIRMTGANGYLGRCLEKHLQKKGYSVSKVSRQMLYGSPEELKEQLAGADAIINLAGAPILQRWTKSRKPVVYNSRVATTRNLCAAINQLPQNEQPRLLISASAIAIYQPGLVHDESSSSFSKRFSGKLVFDWENASADLHPPIRRVILRLGLVLGKDAVMIRKMVPLFKSGLGAVLASGRQAFPFIHIKDVLAIFENVLNDESYEGPFNLVAPERINNEEFVQHLAKQLNRPAFFKLPAWLLKLLWGEAAEVLLETPQVIPERLAKKGFRFNYPTIEKTVREMIQ